MAQGRRRSNGRTIVTIAAICVAAVGCLWFAVEDPLVAGAFFTGSAGIAAIVYVVFTHGLWRSASSQYQELVRQNETRLMLEMMTQYDGLDDSIRRLLPVDVTALRLLPLRDGLDETRGRLTSVETELARFHPDRFLVSRFFVRIRKLENNGYLRREIIRAALEPEAVSFFLDVVDPLDQYVRQLAGEPANVSDRDFYQHLLEEYER